MISESFTLKFINYIVVFHTHKKKLVKQRNIFYLYNSGLSSTLLTCRFLVNSFLSVTLVFISKLDVVFGFELFSLRQYTRYRKKLLEKVPTPGKKALLLAGLVR